MRIVSLVENNTRSELKAKHGLSLYIETLKHKILFDLGSDKTLFENAKKRGIDLSKVDIVIISHGHVDHGGALKRFLEVNSTAKIYIQRKAFEPHYSKLWFMKIPVGIDKKIASDSQVVLLDGDYVIDDELRLFTVPKTEKCYSSANNVLYDEHGADKFLHEQHLMIFEKHTVLLMGCGHSGIVNIMEKASEYDPEVCVGGFHLYNPINKKTVSSELLDRIAKELEVYTQTRFYTCHCTGLKAFRYLSKKLTNLTYLYCGESIELKG